LLKEFSIRSYQNSNNTKKIKIAVIGGGASGLVCAIEASKNPLIQVDVYEQNSKPAKKIIASGNGKCNISNKNLSPQNYESQNPNFLKPVLERFGFRALENYFFKLGLLIKIKEDGKAYPFSGEAKTVANALVRFAALQGVVLHTDTKVINVEKIKNNTGQGFILSFEKAVEPKHYNIVILATGSNAYQKKQEVNFGLKTAQKFTHNIVPTYPALVQLELNSSYPAAMSGVKCEARLQVYDKNTKEELFNSCNDVLFTAYGISGLAVIDASLKLSKLYSSSAEHPSLEIVLNLFSKTPFEDFRVLSDKIIQLKKSLPKLSIAGVLDTFINTKIVNCALDACKIDKNKRCDEVTIKQIKQISSLLTSWRFTIGKPRDLPYAEVCGGGINTKEIIPESFESKKIQDLYFLGELLDATGQRGGYNLHFAFASGYCAGNAIAKKINT
jgi:predicted Rossmann fold flavoprotein